MESHSPEPPLFHPVGYLPSWGAEAGLAGKREFPKKVYVGFLRNWLPTPNRISLRLTAPPQGGSDWLGVPAGRPRSQEAFIPLHRSHRGVKTTEAYGRRLSLKEVHLSSCLFLFIRGSISLKRSAVFPRMNRAPGRGTN